MNRVVLMNDFRVEPEALIQAELRAVERVLRSGWFVLGSEVKKFEAAWASACGVRHAVGVGNGMDAIEIGLRASGIGKGDEVITTPMTAFATVLAILRAGASPVLADIDPDTGLLDIESARRCISRRTKAILLVHLYGQMRSLDRWQELCRDEGIQLLEDCAQSHLASWDGKAAGSWGGWGAYSFYPTKNLGTAGDGGAVVTSDDQLAENARILRNYGQRDRYSHEVLGLNSRLDEVHAALLSVRMEWLAKFTERRRSIAADYIAGIRNSRINLLARPAQINSHVYHLFVILSQERDSLVNYLKSNGVECISHYPIPVHRQGPCKGLRRDPEGVEKSERHAATCLSIPCHPHMTAADVHKVIRTLNEFQ